MQTSLEFPSVSNSRWDAIWFYYFKFRENEGWLNAEGTVHPHTCFFLRGRLPNISHLRGFDTKYGRYWSWNWEFLLRRSDATSFRQPFLRICYKWISPDFAPFETLQSIQPPAIFVANVAFGQSGNGRKLATHALLRSGGAKDRESKPCTLKKLSLFRVFFGDYTIRTGYVGIIISHYKGFLLNNQDSMESKGPRVFFRGSRGVGYMISLPRGSEE